MNAHQNHNALVNEYQESAQTIRRFRIYAFAFQGIIWALLFSLRSFHVQHVNLIATILFEIFLLSRVMDFNLRRNLDIRMSQVTLEGVELERNNPRLKTFFHQVLKQFGIIRIMILRAMFDVMALYFFASSAYRLCVDYNSDLALSIRTFYLAFGLLGFFLGDLYYEPFKSVVRAKQEPFRAKN